MAWRDVKDRRMFSSQTYTPALRLKQGEYNALTDIGTRVSERIVPHFILPPPTEYDAEKGRPLTTDELVPEGGRRIGRYWPKAPCFADARFLFGTLEESAVETWLPQIFEIAQHNHGSATPVATLDDIEIGRARAFARAGEVAERGVAFRLELADLDDPLLGTKLAGALGSVAQRAEDTHVIMDLSLADMSNDEVVAEYMIGAFQRLMEAGLWKRAVVQATSYPEVNPASNGGESLLPRNDWIAWQKAAKSDADFNRLTVFSDFGADSAKFKFGGSAMPIGHYRYSTSRDWFVVRTDTAKQMAEGMREVCEKIIASGHFAGHAFSRGDGYIAECAAGNDGPGNAANWRWANTVHHLTRVTADLGVLRGYEIPPLPRRAPVVQQVLFPAK
jgi:hypothetical protein